jgi:hypothetical protein
MKRIACGLAVVVLTSSLAFGQNAGKYVFVAPGEIRGGGTSQRLYQFGGGIQRALGSRVGAAAEFSALLPATHPRQNANGLFSLNGQFPIPAKGKAAPFGSVGYSLLFRHGTANLFNYGGGVEYWFSEEHALRIELRDHVRNQSSGPTNHYWGIRIGLGFR